MHPMRNQKGSFPPHLSSLCLTSFSLPRTAFAYFFIINFFNTDGYSS